MKTNTTTKQEKLFKTYKEACEFCAGKDTSNENILYNDKTRRYVVELDETGKVIDQAL